MNKKILVAGAITLALVAWAGWQTLQKSSLQAELNSLHTAQENRSGQSKQQADQFNQTIAGLQQQLKEVQDQLAQVKPVTVAVASLPPPARPDPADQIVKQLNSPDMRMMRSERTVESRFGAFIATLKLAPQVEKILKERLKDVYMHLGELSIKAESGEISRAQVQEYDFNGEIRKIIADYTTPEQQTAFVELQAQIPAREREQSKQQMKNIQLMQLGMSAPGLTDANKDIVAVFMAESMMTPTAPAAAGEDPNPTVRRYQAMQAQLQGKLNLPEDQMKIVKDYLQLQIQSARAYQPAR